METMSPERRARARARYLTGLLWHLGAFVIVNGAFWLLDVSVGQDGVQWAQWIAGIWGVALAFHVLAYLVAGRDVEGRFTRKYLDDTR